MSTQRTPRLRSAFPASPSTTKSEGRKDSSQQHDDSPTFQTEPRNAQTNSDEAHMPFIPLSALDAPSQRSYALAIYVVLFAWRLYDYFGLVVDESNSLWHFMKWATIDGLFLYGLPSLRIPWLEWSTFTVTTLFVGHAIFDALLMFRVPIPVEAWIIWIGKIFYDSELAIAERRVKAASLIHNSSLILGKQIIHILPEGSVTLNPESKPFCLESNQNNVHIPLHVNQTTLKSIQLLRTDIDSGVVESVVVTSKEIKKLMREVTKTSSYSGSMDLMPLKIPVKATGLYRLGKVFDEANLEVQGAGTEALVVRCPTASVRPGTQHRCFGELSDFFFDVDATPPLKISYTRIINRGEDTSVSLTWHPEDLESPLLNKELSAIPTEAIGSIHDLSWAQSRRHQIPINETMSTSGGWHYHIDGIRDGCGNEVQYLRDGRMANAQSTRLAQLERDFVVHERPRARLEGCTSQKPIRRPIGESADLPVALNPYGRHETRAPQHHISYTFSPMLDDAFPELGDMASLTEHTIVFKDGRLPIVSAPGLYSLTSVSTDFCSGEIIEPSSCLFMNPPQPDVSVASDEIPDKCAGHSIGIIANLDLVGSPPFTVRYSEQRRGGPITYKSEHIHSLRHQLSFEPREAGHYTYTFIEIADSVYTKSIPLKNRGYKLEQDIKPTAWAHFLDHKLTRSACLEQRVSFEVKLAGEGPWTLEYDLVYGKSRQKMRMVELDSEQVKLETPPLSRGGTYAMTLTSVTDRSGCKVFLDQEAKIEVRQSKPSAAFGQIDGERQIQALKDQKVQIPLRLTGEKPWTIFYTTENDSVVRSQRIGSSNGFLDAEREGDYILTGVSDAACPGVVDPNVASFHVNWIPKPQIILSASSRLLESGPNFVKQPVCEGEQDFFDISLTGNAPYQVKYEVLGKPDHHPQFASSKRESYASNVAAIQMSTSKSGAYKYTISGISDRFYDAAHRSHPIIIRQQVYARPNAAFSNVGRTYSYCKEDGTGNEVIPITLEGTPPFTLEVGIKHQTSSKPEIITISEITAHRYNLQVPRSSLGLGGYSVSILRIVDHNGCQRLKDRTERDQVYVNVVDVPSISPLESKQDFCVGDRVAYALSGTPPFNVFYTFRDVSRKAAVSNTEFRRLAERPGIFTINAVSDRASTDACRARVNMTKVIHELPSVRISKGTVKEVDIHEGGESQILFEFGGTPPFEFTYTRSTNAVKGKKSIILETKHDTSYDYIKSVRAFEEGTYEVVAIRDRYCGITIQGKVVSSTGQTAMT